MDGGWLKVEDGSNMKLESRTERSELSEAKPVTRNQKQTIKKRIKT